MKPHTTYRAEDMYGTDVMNALTLLDFVATDILNRQNGLKEASVRLAAVIIL